VTSLISIKSDQSASRTYNHRGLAEPRQLILVLRWCYAAWLGTWFKCTINVEPGSAEPRFDGLWWNAP